ncbi:MAG: cysteine desulfurase family protein [Verrucomicrobiia bacterium]
MLVGDKRLIYLDYNATTPLDPQVFEAMLPVFSEIFGNPSSIHQIGRRARVLLDEARERAASVLGCKPSEIIFTSGGTESNNLAIFGIARLFKSRGRHIVISSVEHHSVLNCCEYLAGQEGFDVSYLPVNSEGMVDPEDVKRRLRKDTILVSVMAANNEIGTLQPVREIGAICRERGIVFHTDAAQWFGKEEFGGIDELNADLVTLCAHKIYGPKGAALLYVRSPLKPSPIIFGGRHENELRAGTENLAAIVGLVRAMELFLKPPVFRRDRLEPLAERLINLIGRLPDATFRGALKARDRLCNTVAFTVDGVDSAVIIAALDIEGICVSSGSACSSGALEPSHVIAAICGEGSARSLIRFSLGRETVLEDIERVESVLPEIIRRALRATSGAGRR